MGKVRPESARKADKKYSGKFKQLIIRITPDQHNQLSELAQSSGITITELVRKKLAELIPPATA